MAMGRGNFKGKGHAGACLMTLCRELCKNGWTNRDAVWVVDWLGSRTNAL